jgi:hypothetical protein
MNGKTKFAMVLLTGVIATAAHAAPLILPDACGDDRVEFDATIQQGQPSPIPAEGKAQIVFIETFTRLKYFTGGHSPDKLTRFGMDGSWVGATKADSYFTLDVPPGEHHLCSSVKGSERLLGMTTVTVEAGKIYYYEFKIDMRLYGTVGNGGAQYSATFGPLSDDEGKYRVKAYALSAVRPKK